MSSSSIEWLIGIFVALIAGVIAHIYRRIWEMNQASHEKFDQIRKDAAAADDKIWVAHQKLTEQTQAFREDVKEHFGFLARREDIDLMRRDIQARENQIIDSINQLANKIIRSRSGAP